MTLLDDLFDSLSSSSSSSIPKELSDWISSPIHIAGIVLYSILFAVTLILYILKRYRYAMSLRQMSTLFYIGLPVFMLLRTIWFILELNQTEDAGLANNVLNRICFCVFLFVFNALLFYWIDTVHTTVNVAFAKEAFQGSLDYEFITPTGRIMFWIVTGIVIALTLILAIVRTALIKTADKTASGYADMKDTISTIYDVNNIIISLLFLAYGLCFLIYGTTLDCRIRKNTSSKSSDLIKAEVFAVVLMACFAVRCVMFSYRIMTGKYLDTNVYVALSYFVPEIIPSIMCLWSTNTRMFNDADNKLSVPKTPA